MSTTSEFDSMIWRALLVGGIITTAIGAVLTFWPDIAITLIGWLVAIQFVVLGLLFMIGRTITGEGAGSVILGIILVVFVLAVPEGLTSQIRALYARLMERGPQATGPPAPRTMVMRFTSISQVGLLDGGARAHICRP